MALLSEIEFFRDATSAEKLGKRITKFPKLRDDRCFDYRI